MNHHHHVLLPLLCKRRLRQRASNKLHLSANLPLRLKKFPTSLLWSGDIRSLLLQQRPYNETCQVDNPSNRNAAPSPEVTPTTERKTGSLRSVNGHASLSSRELPQSSSLLLLVLGRVLLPGGITQRPCSCANSSSDSCTISCFN
jgi:hypothetical protein